MRLLENSIESNYVVRVKKIPQRELDRRSSLHWDWARSEDAGRLDPRVEKKIVYFGGFTTVNSRFGWRST